MFPLQSRLSESHHIKAQPLSLLSHTTLSHDLWQLFGIAHIAGWDQGCLNRGTQFKNCTTSQLVELQAYATSLVRDLQSSSKYEQPGEGE